MKKIIDEIFAFTIITEDDIEVVPAIELGDFIHPMVGSDMDRIQSLTGLAKKVQSDSGKTIRLYRFSNKEEIHWERKEVH